MDPGAPEFDYPLRMVPSAVYKYGGYFCNLDLVIK